MSELDDEVARLRLKYEQRTGKPVSDDMVEYLKNPDKYSAYSGYLNNVAHAKLGYNFDGQQLPEFPHARSVQEFLKNPDKYTSYDFDVAGGEHIDALSPEDKQRMIEIEERNRIEEMKELARGLVGGTLGDVEARTYKQNMPQMAGALDDEIAKLRMESQKQSQGAPMRPYSIEVSQEAGKGYKGRPAYSIRQVYRD